MFSIISILEFLEIMPSGATYNIALFTLIFLAILMILEITGYGILWLFKTIFELKKLPYVLSYFLISLIVYVSLYLGMSIAIPNIILIIGIEASLLIIAHKIWSPLFATMSIDKNDMEGKTATIIEWGESKGKCRYEGEI